MTESPTWPSEWLRGALGPAVLSIVADGETYGYLVAQRLAEAGLGVVKGGTLYPLLTRYEADGLLQSTWREGDGGPGRKYFTLTTAGRIEVDRIRREWPLFTAAAGSAIAGTNNTTTGEGS